MRSFAWAMLAPMVAIGVAAFAACGGETDTLYGPPGGLRNAHLPDPTGSTTGTTPPLDGGTPPPVEGGTTDGPATMSCAVSFKTQIFPNMQDNGPWKCSNAQCHGGTTPPTLSGIDATATYTTLKGYVTNAKPYINSASMDPAQSNFECNLKGQCLAGQMPVTGGAVGATAASAADIGNVDTWLKCGAPNN